MASSAALKLAPAVQAAHVLSVASGVGWAVKPWPAGQVAGLYPLNALGLLRPERNRGRHYGRHHGKHRKPDSG